MKLTAAMSLALLPLTLTAVGQTPTPPTHGLFLSAMDRTIKPCSNPQRVQMPDLAY